MEEGRPLLHEEHVGVVPNPHVDLRPVRVEGHLPQPGQLQRPETDVGAVAAPRDHRLEDGHPRRARDLEQPRRPVNGAHDELGPAHREVGVGERVLEVDHEHGRPLAGLDRALSVSAGDPRIVRRELDSHYSMPSSRLPAMDDGGVTVGRPRPEKYSVSELPVRLSRSCLRSASVAACVDLERPLVREDDAVRLAGELERREVVEDVLAHRLGRSLERVAVAGRVRLAELDELAGRERDARHLRRQDLLARRCRGSCGTRRRARPSLRTRPSADRSAGRPRTSTCRRRGSGCAG